MPNYSVELQQLQAMAEYFTTADYPYFQELREAFKLLKHTGCRINEIFEIQRWWVVSGYTVQFQPQKGNNPRTVILNSDFNNFLAAIQGGYSPFLGRTTSQFWYLFNKINPFGKIFADTKEITAYFFRYLYLRTLQEDGLTIAQIASEMGYTSETAVHNYLETELTSTYEVPVEPSDPIPAGHIDLITESSYFNGVDSGYQIANPFNSNKISFYIDFVCENTTIGFAFGYYSYRIEDLHFTLQVRKYSTYVRVNVISYKTHLQVYFNWFFDIYNLSNIKYVFTCDFSEVGSLGGNYRNVYLNRYCPDLSPQNTLIENIEFNKPHGNFLIIGGRQYDGYPISYRFKGTINKLIFWNDILSEANANQLFNL